MCLEFIPLKCWINHNFNPMVGLCGWFSHEPFPHCRCFQVLEKIMLKHLPTVWQILPEAVQLELKTKVLEDTKALCGGTRWVGQVGMVKPPFLPNHGASRNLMNLASKLGVNKLVVLLESYRWLRAHTHIVYIYIHTYVILYAHRQIEYIVINGNRYWLAKFFSRDSMVGQAWCFCQFVACSLPPKKGALPRCLSCGLVFTFPGSKSTCWREKQIRSKIDWYKKPPKKSKCFGSMMILLDFIQKQRI